MKDSIVKYFQENFDPTLSVFIGLFVFLLCASQGRKNKSSINQTSQATGKFSKPIQRKIPQVSWGYISSFVPWLDGCRTLLKMRNDGLILFEELRAKYGTLYELPIGPIKVIGVSDTEVIHKLLTSTSIGHVNKPRAIYHVWYEKYLRTGLFASEGDLWYHHRKVANRAFTLRSLQNHFNIMNSNTESLISELVQMSEKNASYRIGDTEIECKKIKEMIAVTIFCIISETIVGADACPKSEQFEALQMFLKGKEITLSRFVNPFKLIGPIWRFHPDSRELARVWEGLIDFGERIISRYSKKLEAEDENTKPELFSRTQDHKELSGDNEIGSKPCRCLIEEMILSGLLKEEIMSELGTFFAAGFETTCTAVETLMLHLALNQDIQEICRREVDTLFQEKVSSTLDVGDLSNLKYLEQCIQENLRLTATVPHFYRQLDVPLQVNDELAFKKGDILLVMPWVVHRDPNIYPNPMKFDPDRWLKENVKERNIHSFIPYSGGIRNCIGAKFSTMETKLLMAHVLRNFEIHTSVKCLNEVKFLFEVSIRPEKDFNITLVKRNQKDN